MPLPGQQTGSSLTPSGAGPEQETLVQGPPDPETGLPKYTMTVTEEFEHRFGEAPIRRRKFRAVQEIFEGQSTSRSDIYQTVNAVKGSSHPTFPGLTLIESKSVESTETTGSSLKLITEIEAVYSVPPDEDEDPQQHPLSKPDTWSFQTQGASLPALYYFNEAWEEFQPLTNSAGDYIKGLEADEAQTKVVIRGNRPTFPSGLATALTNCVNEDPFLGGAQDHWKCQGISGELKYETWNDTWVRYWEVTIELLYRQTGWNLRIPDIGFNFIQGGVGGVKKRAMVFDDENKVWLASAEPIGLNGLGDKAGDGNLPAILERRVYRRVKFSPYFGTPPA